jgi:hypothetical protein
MGIDISQPLELPPGYALLTVSPPPEWPAEGLMFSIEQPPRGFLQAYGQAPWGTTHAWLKPFAVATGAGGLGLTLGPDQTWNLKPNVTYVLRLRGSGSGEPIALLRMAWKAIRMPSQAPQMLPELAPLQAGRREPEPEPIIEITPEIPLAGTSPERTKPQLVEPEPKLVPSKTRKTWLWIFLALVVLLAAAGGAWFALRHKAQITPVTPPPAQPQEGPTDTPTARDFLKTTPSTEAAYTEAQRYLKKASPEALQGALVLLNHAASAGSGPAATEIGRMYDPDGFDPKASAMKAADPDKALLWYHRAAQANDPEGLYRLGKLLMSGHAEAPGLGPEQGAADLQRASDLGYAPAKQELDKLHAKP